MPTVSSDQHSDLITVAKLATPINLAPITAKSRGDACDMSAFNLQLELLVAMLLDP